MQTIKKPRIGRDSMSGIEVNIVYTSSVDFFRNLREAGGDNKGIAIISIIFQNTNNKIDYITLDKYIARNYISEHKNLSIKKIIHLVANEIPNLEFRFSSTRKAKKFSLLKKQEIKGFLNALKSDAESLRGWPDSIILFNDDSVAIRPTSYIGYIPSVPTSYVTYPNAIERDTDWGSEVIDYGNPVVVESKTKEQEAYPSELRMIKGKEKIAKMFLAKYERSKVIPKIFFGIEYEIEKIQQEPQTTPSSHRIGLGPLGFLS